MDYEVSAPDQSTMQAFALASLGADLTHGSMIDGFTPAGVRFSINAYGLKDGQAGVFAILRLESEAELSQDVSGVTVTSPIPADSPVVFA